MSDSTILPGGQRVERTRTANGVASAQRRVLCARGAALIGLAVIIGIVLLQLIDDGTSGPIGDGGCVGRGCHLEHHHSTASSDSTSSTTPTTAATPVKPPAQVAVLVLNGSGRPGAATAQSNSLKAKGYQTLTPPTRRDRAGQHRLLQARLRSRVHDGRELGRWQRRRPRRSRVRRRPAARPRAASSSSARSRPRPCIAALGPLVEHASRAAVLVDFDGSLAPIIDDPDAVARRSRRA